MKQKGGKEKLMAVIKALSAMRLTKDDPTPSLVLALQDGKPVIVKTSSANDFLFQGSVGAAFNGDKLQQYGITHILTCASGIGQRFTDKYTYLQLPLLDTPMCNIKEHFEAARKFINSCKEVNGRVLVHCFAGKSRASTITLSYMMAEMEVDLKQAFEHLKSQRPIAQPNIGFLYQLKAFEKELFGINSDVPLQTIPHSSPDTDDQEMSQIKEIKDSKEVIAERNQ